MMQIATQIAIALLGCWEPVSGGRFGEVTCVTMGAEALHLRVVTIVPGRPTTESVLRLDGTRQPVDAEGCVGWEEARPSGDGERIVLAAEVKCGTAPMQRRSAVLLITPRGEWLHAEGSGIATVGNVQLQLLRPVRSYLSLPEDVRGATAPVLAEAEATRNLLQRSAARAADLVELEEMGAADALIDVVVAASNPKAFSLGIGGPAISAVDDDAGGARQLLSDPMPAYFGFGYPGFYYGDLAFLYGCSSVFSSRYSLYDNRNFCSAYSYGGYDRWNSYRGGYWPGVIPMGPVVIIPRPTGTPDRGGRVVRGSGYTSSDASGSGSRSAAPRGDGTGGSSTAGRSGGSTGASTGASTGSSTGSSAGGTRTAQPRKP